MGGGYHGGFGNTFRSKDLEKKNESQEKKTIKASVPTKEELISELKTKGINFTEKDIIFITKDMTGQTVWLEKGSPTAGLEHILSGTEKTKGHATDFENAFNIQRNQIPMFLNNVISQGQVISNQIKKRGNRECFERVYYYEGRYYVVTGIGTNGFIVSAYPKKIKEGK